MKSHLSAAEIAELIITGNEDVLSTNNTHLHNCPVCQKVYSDQRAIHNSLLNIAAKKSTVKISQFVMEKLEKVNFVFKPKNKTDWSFLLALVTLFSVGVWILFNGDINTLFGSYFQESISPLTEIKGFNLNFSPLRIDLLSILNIFSMKYFYPIIGIIAVMFYTLLEKRLYNFYKFHKIK